MCGREIELAYEYVEVSAVLEIKVTIQNTAGVSNPRTARLYYAARGHNCKLCIQYKYYTITYFYLFEVRSAKQPSINRCGPLL